MSMAEPRAPFTADHIDTANTKLSAVRDADGSYLAMFYGPDRFDRATRLAADYAAFYSPVDLIDPLDEP